MRISIYIYTYMYTAGLSLSTSWRSSLVSNLWVHWALPRSLYPTSSVGLLALCLVSPIYKTRYPKTGVGYRRLGILGPHTPPSILTLNSAHITTTSPDLMQQPLFADNGPELALFGFLKLLLKPFILNPKT